MYIVINYYHWLYFISYSICYMLYIKSYIIHYTLYIIYYILFSVYYILHIIYYIIYIIIYVPRMPYIPDYHIPYIYSTSHNIPYYIAPISHIIPFFAGFCGWSPAGSFLPPQAQAALAPTRDAAQHGEEFLPGNGYVNDMGDMLPLYSDQVSYT